MATFQRHEDDALIEQVRKNPVLFNMELTDYRDGTLKEHVWGEVAATVNRTVADCKKRWKYLRDSYSRCKRTNITAKSSGLPKPPKWCYFEPLRFLDGETVDGYHTEINIKTDDSPDEDEPGDDTDGNFEFCTVNNEESTAETIEPNSDTKLDGAKLGRKRKRDIDSGDEYEQPLAQYVNVRNKCAKAKTNETSGDDIDSFCAYVRDILKKLNPNLRVQAKSKIFNLMSQYELKSLNSDG